MSTDSTATDLPAPKLRHQIYVAELFSNQESVSTDSEDEDPLVVELIHKLSDVEDPQSVTSSHSTAADIPLQELKREMSDVDNPGILACDSTAENIPIEELTHEISDMKIQHNLSCDSTAINIPFGELTNDVSDIRIRENIESDVQIGQNNRSNIPLAIYTTLIDELLIRMKLKIDQNNKSNLREAIPTLIDELQSKIDQKNKSNLPVSIHILIDELLSNINVEIDQNDKSSDSYLPVAIHTLIDELLNQINVQIEQNARSSNFTTKISNEESTPKISDVQIQENEISTDSTANNELTNEPCEGSHDEKDDQQCNCETYEQYFAKHSDPEKSNCTFTQFSPSDPNYSKAIVHHPGCTEHEYFDIMTHFIPNYEINLSPYLPWNFVSDFNTTEHISKQFVVVSYNVLSPNLIELNKELYQNCAPAYLTWDYRWWLLKNAFMIVDADVLTLQEVMLDVYVKYMVPFFCKLGYKGLYKKRTATRMRDGCAIFYKEKTFKLVEYTDVEYEQTHFMNRQNVGLVCIFEHLQSRQKVCIATTHLLFNPKRIDIKLAQMMMLLSEIERLSYVGDASMKYCPVIMTGDFNSPVNSAVINLIKTGQQAYGTAYGQQAYGKSLALFGILNSGQHEAVLKLRHRIGGKYSRSVLREKETSSMTLRNSSRTSSQSARPKSPEALPHDSGTIGHQFCFLSVYDHFSYDGRKEITSIVHNDTVDYIFYSRVSFLN